MRAITATRDFSPLHRDFDDLLGRFFGSRTDGLPSAGKGSWIPPLESYLKEGELVIRIDVPGVSPDALDISVEGDRLSVKGERKSSREDESGRSYREVVYGAFERTVFLPWDVNSEDVKASCRNGVLEITMRAPEKVGAKKIPVVS